jgi:hypothetical protein
LAPDSAITASRRPARGRCRRGRGPPYRRDPCCDDLGIEAAGQRQALLVEAAVAGHLADGEFGDILAEIAAMEIDQHLGLGRPFAEDGIGEGLAEAAVLAAGEGEIDVLAVDRADILRTHRHGREIEDRQDGDAAAEALGPDPALELHRRLDARDLVHMHPGHDAKPRPGPVAPDLHHGPLPAASCGLARASVPRWMFA